MTLLTADLGRTKGATYWVVGQALGEERQPILNLARRDLHG